MEIRQTRGVVLRTTGSWYRVRDSKTGGVYSCRAGGRLRLHGDRSTNPFAVGDGVVIEFHGQDESPLIIEREKRRNAIVRRSVNLSKQRQIVAANLDRAFLVVTVASPETSTGFIDRFLVTAEAYGVPTTLVFNKCDLYKGQLDAIARLDYLEEVYSKAGYSSLRTSAETGEGLGKLKSSLASAGINLLSGHSGVGKSTLINRLVPGLELKTGGVSSVHQKGKHTTTFAEMFALPSGGYIVDTPGIKGFGLVELERGKLHHYFPELFAKLPACKFHNCLHRNEPKCAVRQAVQKEEIAESRYLNYLDLYENFEANTSYR